MSRNFGAFSERKFRGRNFLDKVGEVESKVREIMHAEANAVSPDALEGSVRNWSVELEGEMRAGDLGNGQMLAKADAVEVDWWLPMTLADDAVTIIYCACMQTISSVKYLYVGGTFTRIGGIAATNIARYNFGTRQWEAVNGGVNGAVYCIAFSPADVLYIGGAFTDAGADTSADFIAKDNSGSWVNVNGGVDNNVFIITWSPADVLYIGGQFHDAGADADADFLAKDNAGSWVHVNSVLDSYVYAIDWDAADVLHIGGVFTNAGADAAADYIAKDNSGSWVNVNGGLGVGAEIRAMKFAADGTLYLGGDFVNAGGDSLADYIVRTTAAGSWENVGGGLNGVVLSLTFDNDENLIANGTFTDAGGVAEADRIAYFNGMSWLPFSNGGGLSGVGGYVWDAVCDSDTGTVYAVGDFDTAGTIKTACIAAYVKPLSDALDMIAGLFEQYQARATATFLPLAGGTVSGTLTVSTRVAANWLRTPRCSTLTIASGSITPVGTFCPVETQGGAASDDLDTIDTTNMLDGDWIVLTAADGTHDVVIKHNTGNIANDGGADFTLDTARDKWIGVYSSVAGRISGFGINGA